ncbi:succinylglutamate desuccinylase/aspartoacylase family protein [Candidatus Parcubacteria bacterium]|nr:succinylglutamate desuccinylase/aspartoacylase family protein [Patescibacteria group bacterium]MCG2693298.1 succinylglutamate desuccinylase/aspartoacylase family protein [Candidatus Parcubacteria bacterium]
MNKKILENLPPHIKYSSLKILTGSDLSRRSLPLMLAKSPNPGPVVWLAACVHGDEVGGIVVVQEIFKKIKKNLLKGALYTFPLMNPLGFETISRHIALTLEDLNRSFPGNKQGSLAERIADKIFTNIIQTKPTLVLDLHNDWKKSIPYALIDPCPGPNCQQAYKKTKELSQQTGLLTILDTEDTSATLSYSLLQQNIPALSLELGESYVINEANVESGVKAIWKILAHLQMVRPLPEFTEKPFNFSFSETNPEKILKYSNKPLSSTSGIIRFLTGPGVFVKKGQPIAKIYNAFGKLEEVLLALGDGFVLGYSDYSMTLPGMPLMAFGLI